MDAIVTILVRFHIFYVITDKYTVILHCHTVAQGGSTFPRVMLSAWQKGNSIDIKENISEVTDDSRKPAETTCVALVLQ